MKSQIAALETPFAPIISQNDVEGAALNSLPCCNSKYRLHAISHNNSAPLR
jgi:hypothetical protein